MSRHRPRGVDDEGRGDDRADQAAQLGDGEVAEPPDPPVGRRARLHESQARGANGTVTDQARQREPDPRRRTDPAHVGTNADPGVRFRQPGAVAWCRRHQGVRAVP